MSAQVETTDAVRDDRRGDRGHPPGEAGGRRRRGRPRERRRPDDRGAVRDARGDQLHGDPRARAHLPVPDGGALRRARPQADDLQQRDAERDRVHDRDRGARGRDHRHLRRRPGAHDPGGDRPDQGPARPRPAGPRLPAAGEPGRRPPARRPDRGGRRPRAPGGPQPGRRRLRDHERGRDDGPRAGPDPVLRAARDQDGHGRGPDRVPAPHREAGRAHDHRAAADLATATSPLSRSARC